AEIREARLVVAPGLDAAQVEAVAIRAGNELALLQREVGDHLAIEADGAERPARRPEGSADLFVGRGPDWLPERAGELCCLETVVAADEREDDSPVLLRVWHRLRRRGEVDAKELGELLAGNDTGRLDLGRRVERLREVGGARRRARNLEVRGEIAVHAGDERVLADAGGREEVARLAAAHHPRLRLHVGVDERAAVEDPVI